MIARCPSADDPVRRASEQRASVISASNSVPRLRSGVSLADAYDALTTERPYRPALAHEAAMELLRREALCGWRRRGLVELFSRTLKVDEVPD